jgi:hypothetical protein
LAFYNSEFGITASSFCMIIVFIFGGILYPLFTHAVFITQFALLPQRIPSSYSIQAQAFFGAESSI